MKKTYYYFDNLRIILMMILLQLCYLNKIMAIMKFYDNDNNLVGPLRKLIKFMLWWGWVLCIRLQVVLIFSYCPAWSWRSHCSSWSRSCWTVVYCKSDRRWNSSMANKYCSIFSTAITQWHTDRIQLKWK